MGITLNIEVGIVDWVVFVGTRGGLAEVGRIKHFPAAETCRPYFAATLAAIEAKGTQATHRNDAAATIESVGGFVGVGAAKIHRSTPEGEGEGERRRDSTQLDYEDACWEEQQLLDADFGTM
jgi:hypothetical protein